MITESYVSFEVAKLLNDAGADFETHGYYNRDGIEVVSLNDLWAKKLGYIKRPSLSMATHWLLLNNIVISLRVDRYAYFYYSVSKIKKDFEGYVVGIEEDVYVTPWYNTAEEACNAAIKYCLENLIK